MLPYIQHKWFMWYNSVLYLRYMASYMKHMFLCGKKYVAKNYSIFFSFI